MSSEVTPWLPYTPTLSISIGNGVVGGFYRFVGDTLDVRWALVFGSTTENLDTPLSVGLPAGLGLTIHTAKYPAFIEGKILAQLASQPSYVLTEITTNAPDIGTKVWYAFVDETPVMATGDVLYGTFSVPVKQP